MGKSMHQLDGRDNLLIRDQRRGAQELGNSILESFQGQIDRRGRKITIYPARNLILIDIHNDGIIGKGERGRHRGPGHRPW